MRAMFTIVLLAACCAVAGCATPGTAAGPQSRPASGLDPDFEYVARVEAAARRRGVDVTWVNMPRVQDRRRE